MLWLLVRMLRLRLRLWEHGIKAPLTHGTPYLASTVLILLSSRFEKRL